MKQIYDLSRHPKITDTHKARLSELDELLSSFSGVLGLSDVSEEDLRGIHSDLRDTVKEIHSIRDSLTTPKNK
jgi:acetate kinase